MSVAPPGGQDRIMIYGPKTDRILAGVLTVASGGWIILILLGVAGVGPSPWPVRVVRHRRRLAARGKKAEMTALRTHFTFRVFGALVSSVPVSLIKGSRRKSVGQS